MLLRKFHQVWYLSDPFHLHHYDPSASTKQRGRNSVHFHLVVSLHVSLSAMLTIMRKIGFASAERGSEREKWRGRRLWRVEEGQ